MNHTYTDTDGCVRCTECLRVAEPMPPTERLYLVAKRALKYFTAKLKGGYFSQHEDLFVARELYDVLALVDAEKHAAELVDRR